MDADYSVELGPPGEEATLEFPWDSGEAGGPHYFDLKLHPERLASVVEAVTYPELAEFLRRVNSPASLFETAKCDVWSDDNLGPDEEIYGGQWKVGAYIDVVFCREQAAARFSFARHEQTARGLAALLKNTEEIPGACEAIVRRCYYSPGIDRSGPGETEPEAPWRSGFYLTLYVFGYGCNEAEARRQWRTGLERLGNALLQLPA